MYADNRLIHDNRIQTKEKKKIIQPDPMQLFYEVFFLLLNFFFFNGIKPLIYSRKYFLPRREPNFR